MVIVELNAARALPLLRALALWVIMIALMAPVWADGAGDIAHIDRLLTRPAAAQAEGETREPIRLWAQASHSPQGRQYRAYLQKADEMTRQLMAFRERLRQRQGDITLQQLGAFCQSLRMERAQLRERLGQGEDKFHSYRLMSAAVTHLEDAWRTWRRVNLFRADLRSSTLEAAMDDDAVQIKLQRAQQAIEDLRVITQARAELDRELNESF
ncbi:MAG: hypothetical protein IPK79_07265 [Vampirovibrionales bacterium]|nr:hypothetical protein [Vampirovibrionales bacterium]